jgi:hypothetical protein
MAATDIPLPNSVWPYWLLSAAVVFGLPLTSLVYFSAVLRSGLLPANADSISIPIFGSVILAIVLVPVTSLITYLCVRRYKVGGTLLLWRHDRMIQSLVLSVIFGGPAVALIYAMGEVVFTKSAAFDFIPMPYFVVCVAWLAGLRAAALASFKPRE